MSRHLTLNIISAIPFSNLNRDDTGTPKRIKQGGVLRGMHSSQSIKRGARARYEEASGDISVRSGNLAEAAVEQAFILNSDLDEKQALKLAKTLIGKLTKGEAKEGESARSTWLSAEELATIAQTVATAQETEAATEVESFINGNKTGSLAIAAFGRMFANSPTLNTEAAISVSPAISTHQVSIDTDYFSTGDDIGDAKRESGATFLGVAQYTNGVFYRSVTIDKGQLQESWSAYSDEGSRENLNELIRSLIYGQPRGKQNSTAPYVLPALVLAEEQRYRTAYDFESPVIANGSGGFMKETIDKLERQYLQARKFDSANFGPVEILSGTYEGLEEKFDGLEVVGLQDLIDGVVEWILND